jgi:hypothetical protein
MLLVFNFNFLLTYLLAEAGVVDFSSRGNFFFSQEQDHCGHAHISFRYTETATVAQQLRRGGAHPMGWAPRYLRYAADTCNRTTIPAGGCLLDAQASKQDINTSIHHTTGQNSHIISLEDTMLDANQVSHRRYKLHANCLLTYNACHNFDGRFSAR